MNIFMTSPRNLRYVRVGSFKERRRASWTVPVYDPTELSRANRVATD